LVVESSLSSESFLEFFRKSRLLKSALVFIIIYFVGVVFGFAFLYMQGTVYDTVYSVDFRVFFEAGQMFSNSPGDIYTVNPNGLPFRYLPTFAAYISLFTIIPMPILYLVNISIMLIFQIATVAIVYHICVQSGVTPSTKNFEKTLAILMITPPHVINYIFGQISQLVIVLVLLALLILIVSKEDTIKPFFIAGLLIGLASTVKPFCIVFAPFLIPFSLKNRYGIGNHIKQVVGVILGGASILLPNLVYFVMYPSALDGFIQVNLQEGLTGQHSTSLTRLILTFIPSTMTMTVQWALIILLGGFVFGMSYIRFLRTPNGDKKYIHHFADMMFLVLLIYPDSWFLFLAIWYAFYAPAVLDLYNSPKLQEDIRSIDILWSGGNNLIAFFTIGILLHYLILGFDPIIPLWILGLYILYQRISTKIQIRVKVDTFE